MKFVPKKIVTHLFMDSKLFLKLLSVDIRNFGLAGY